MKAFNVICENNGRFISYNVMPYFVNRYNESRQKPKTFEEFKDFVKQKSMYMYWGRCEYEIIISNWPGQTKSEKWDIHKQIMMNLDIVTKVLMKNVK